MATSAAVTAAFEDWSNTTSVPAIHPAPALRETAHPLQSWQCTSRRVPKWSVLLCLLMVVLCTAALPTAAQSFQHVPQLYFTKAYEGANPLPQVITVASTGTSFGFSGSVVAGTGGNWLSVNISTACCYNTPRGITVTAAPSATLAAGTYTSQIVLKSSAGTQTLTIPVALTVVNAAPVFDSAAGALTFSMETKGTAPPAQVLPVRNGGSGTLSFTAGVTTADGGSWLSVSAASGTAPAMLGITINPANLPGKGLTAATYVGQVLLKTAGSVVTVPITMTVGDPVFQQAAPLSFSKEYAQGNPPAQVLNLASTGATFGFSASVVNSTGGNWLSVNLSTACCYSLPQSVTVTANPVVTLAPGTYTAEIIAFSSDGTRSLVIPVSLAIHSSSATFFDTSAGALTFSMQTGGTAPPLQALPIRNAGQGTLSWTATATTADSGHWISLSASSGTAPSTLNIGVVPANLPGGGLVAGTFTGQVVLKATGDTITIPVTVTVGDSVFRQVNPLTFTKVYGGTNPLSQVVTIASTHTDFGFAASTIASTGGNWLSTNLSTACCYSTPQAVTVTVKPDITLPAGTYTSEIVLRSSTGAEAMVIPVTLQIETADATFFDALPGQLTFSMLTNGTAPPPEMLQIRNAGEGTLKFALVATTADGGKWIAFSATSGTAPYLVNIGITKSSLPGGGLIAGTFTGEITLQTTGNTVTIPVSVTVGASVFRQINPLDFTKVYGGANPLPQVITVASTGSSVGFSAATVSATGGAWLSTNLSTACCYSTPQAVTVTVNPSTTLAVGSYTAQVIFKSSTGGESMVVPVTLTIAPAASSSLDTLTGGLTFSLLAKGAAPAAQSLHIRNAGPGSLNWATTDITADSGKWLVLSSSSGVAPANPIVAISPANLPGQGLVPGTFTGQVLVQSPNGIVSVPVTVTINDPVFVQPAEVSFSKSYQGTDPAAKTITLASSGASIAFNALTVNATGGNWLSTSLSTACCYNTPQAITLTAKPSVNLAAGMYTAEVIVKSSTGGVPVVIPVSLLVNSGTATAAPTFTPAGGTFASTQSVTLADSTHDAAIYYTTDGSTPTSASKQYAGPISVASSQTVKAIAIAIGYPQSSVATANYVISSSQAATPSAMATITIAEASTGATVYYTINGTTPTTSSAKYTGPITISSSAVLKFIAIGGGFSASAVRTVSTTIQ